MSGSSPPELRAKVHKTRPALRAASVWAVSLPLAAEAWLAGLLSAFDGPGPEAGEPRVAVAVEPLPPATLTHHIS